jgi:Clostridial hydrophobic W
MSEAGAPPAPKSVTELRVTAHVMTLDNGLFCVVHSGARGPDEASGLPGVRITSAPGANGHAAAVAVSSFRPDGWLSGQTDAALIRVSDGPAKVLVTIYQSPDSQQEAPRLQLVRLGEASAAAPVPVVSQQQPQPVPAPAASPTATVAAHVQLRGDVQVALGEWIGERESRAWIEGFGIAPPEGVPPEDIEYQAVLGRGWLSPWAQGGQYCGSRGMALPLLGLRVRLRGASAELYDCLVSATFIDGTAVGPLANGEACETEALAALESFKVEIRRKPVAAQAAPERRAPAAAPRRRRA